MLFNSLAFLYFLPIALATYWALRKRLRLQNILLVALSYVFYGYWDARFLLLIVASTLIDFTLANLIGRTREDARRRIYLVLSVCANLGILGFFKYYGFFAASFIKIAALAGLSADLRTLNIVLPVGISFYTFQTMSYTIDVYRRKIAPSPDIAAVAAYVAFFPQLVAGPIERGSHLLPQMLRPRTVTQEQLEDGLWLILLGYFRKSVIADNVAILVDRVYDRPSEIGAATLFVATLAFAIQIYCDFSGYSGIARGVAKWFGVDLMVNFRSPYAATDIQDFWRRWHISLSTWLRDYLYVPLGGNRLGETRTYINLMTTMLLGGLWHGAGWNFVLWGAWQGLGLAFHRAIFRDRGSGTLMTLPRTIGSWLVTFVFVLQGWLFFRTSGLGNVVLLSKQWGRIDIPLGYSFAQVLTVFGFFLILLGLDYLESRRYERLVFHKARLEWRILVAAAAFVIILAFGSFRDQPFLYFQF